MKASMPANFITFGSLRARDGLKPKTVRATLIAMLAFSALPEWNDPFFTTEIPDRRGLSVPRLLNPNTNQPTYYGANGQGEPNMLVQQHQAIDVEDGIAHDFLT